MENICYIQALIEMWYFAPPANTMVGHAYLTVYCWNGSTFSYQTRVVYQSQNRPHTFHVTYLLWSSASWTLSRCFSSLYQRCHRLHPWVKWSPSPPPCRYSLSSLNPLEVFQSWNTERSGGLRAGATGNSLSTRWKMVRTRAEVLMMARFRDISF